MTEEGRSSEAPEAVASFLRTATPVLLVGGQAVNLWALHYRERVTDLAPFVSRDVDIPGDRAVLEEIARSAGGKLQYFPLKPPSNEVGVVIARDRYDNPLLIEVLRYVHGVSNQELQEPEYTFEIGMEGTRVRVPGPVALLKAKVANVADLKARGTAGRTPCLDFGTHSPRLLARLDRSSGKGRANGASPDQLP